MFRRPLLALRNRGAKATPRPPPPTGTEALDFASLKRDTSRLPPELRRLVADYCVDARQQVRDACDREQRVVSSDGGRATRNENTGARNGEGWVAPALLRLVVERQRPHERRADWVYACDRACLTTATWLLALYRANRYRDAGGSDNNNSNNISGGDVGDEPLSQSPAVVFPLPDIFAWHTQSLAPYYTAGVERTLRLTTECLYLDVAAPYIGRRRALPLDQVAAVHRLAADTLLVTARSGTRLTVFVDAAYAQRIATHLVERASRLAAQHQQPRPPTVVGVEEGGERGHSR